MIKINREIIELKKFPDGTPVIKYKPQTDIKSVIVEWNFENNEEMVYLYMLTKHIKDYLKKEDIDAKCYLYMYYIPNARYDRVHNPDECFTLKYFCNFINDLKFDKVFVMDAHSNVSLALLDNVIQLKTTKKYIEKTIEIVKPDLLYFPDEGSSKRYADWFKMPYAFGIKKRDWDTGNILGIKVQNEELVKDKSVLIIDDISSKGGTFYHSAKTLKELGAKDIYLHITHCEDTILKGDLIESGLVKKIYTTNSILKTEHPLIHKYIL